MPHRRNDDARIFQCIRNLRFASYRDSASSCVQYHRRPPFGGTRFDTAKKAMARTTFRRIPAFLAQPSIFHRRFSPCPQIREGRWFICVTNIDSVTLPAVVASTKPNHRRRLFPLLRVFPSSARTDPETYMFRRQYRHRAPVVSHGHVTSDNARIAALSSERFMARSPGSRNTRAFATGMSRMSDEEDFAPRRSPLSAPVLTRIPMNRTEMNRTER